MSDVQLQIPENKTPEVPSQKKIGPLRAYAILAVYTLVLFAIGIAVGKFFFWNNYNKTPLADRQISTLQAKLQANPKDPKTLTDLGWNYAQKGDFNQALNYYRTATECDNKYYPAYLNQGTVYLQTQKYELAIQSLKQAVTLSPKASAAHLNLGIAYIKTQKFEEAVNELTIADQNGPGSVETLYQLGFAYENLQKYQDSAEQYNAALKFDPKYTKAIEGLTRIKAKLPQ